jgi:hypothetical protein
MERRIDQYLAETRGGTVTPDTGQSHDFRLHYYAWVETVFRRQLRYSVIVAVHAAVEETLVALCEQAQQLARQPFSPHDLRGRGLDRFRMYLCRTLGVKSGGLSCSEQVKQLSIVRNCIAHMSASATLATISDHRRPAFLLVGTADGSTARRLVTEGDAA